MMKLLGNRVLVKREPKKEAEGFEAVKAIDDFTSRGVVVQVGDEVTKEDIKVGATVAFAKFSPDTHSVTVDDEEMKAVLVSDIIAIGHGG